MSIFSNLLGFYMTGNWISTLEIDLAKSLVIFVIAIEAKFPEIPPRMKQFLHEFLELFKSHLKEK